MKKTLFNSKETYSWLFKNSKKQIFPLVLLTIGSIFLSLCAISFALCCRGLVDGAIEKNKDKITKFAVILLCLIIAQILLRLFSKSIEEKTKAKLDITYQNNLFSHIMKKNYSEITSFHSGELINRFFSDIPIISEGITTILPNLIYMIVSLICALLILFSINAEFSMVFVITGLAVLFISIFFREKIKILHKSSQTSEGKVRSFFQECISNILVVKVFNAENKIKENTNILQKNSYDARLKRRNMNVLANAGIGFIFQIGYLYALIWGSLSIYSGIMTFGTLTAILQLVNQVQHPFLTLSGMMPKYYNMLASTERIIDLENLEDEETTNKKLKDFDKIVLKNITFSYDKNLVFDNTSFELNKGDFIAITGRSGIGKSTLVKLLLGIYKNSDGEMFALKSNEKINLGVGTRNLFSYVPQGNFMFSGSIKKNIILLNNEATEENINEAINLSCANKFINNLKNGINTVIGEKGIGLSEGQIQRIAIARALLSKSPIILLDEATSALDKETEEQLLKNLRTIKEKTFIMISHKKASIDICDKEIKIIGKKIIKED